MDPRYFVIGLILFAAVATATQCTSDSDCGTTEYCWPQTNYCYESQQCFDDSECPAGYTCQNMSCFPADVCGNGISCPSGKVCEEGICTEMMVEKPIPGMAPGETPPTVPGDQMQPALNCSPIYGPCGPTQPCCQELPCCGGVCNSDCVQEAGDPELQMMPNPEKVPIDSGPELIPQEEPGPEANGPEPPTGGQGPASGTQAPVSGGMDMPVLAIFVVVIVLLIALVFAIAMRRKKETAA